MKELGHKGDIMRVNKLFAAVLTFLYGAKNGYKIGWFMVSPDGKTYSDYVTYTDRLGKNKDSREAISTVCDLLRDQMTDSIQQVVTGKTTADDLLADSRKKGTRR